MSLEQDIPRESNKKVNWKVNLPVLWLSVFLCCASYTMCIPFLPVYLLKEMHVAAGDINHWSGIVYSITFLGSTIMAPIWGALADHVGQRRMAIRAGVGLAFCYVATGICQDVYQLFAVRALCGVVAGFVPACMSMASSSLPTHKVGWGMGLMQTALASGTILGPLMGGYFNSWFGMRMSFYLGGLSLGIATALVYLVVHEPVANVKKLSTHTKINLLEDLKHALSNKELLYIMSMFFIIQSCVMTIQPLITMYTGELMGAMDDEAIKMSGIIFSIAGIAGILAAPFWGKRGQHWGYIRTFCLVTFCAGFINLFQVFIIDVWQFATIQFVYGLFLAGANPNINANITKATDNNMRGRAFGLVTSAQMAGGVAGPLLGGCLGNYMSTKYVLVVTGCILMTTAISSYFTKIKRGQK